MKKIIPLAFVICLTFSNCMFVGFAGKKPLYLVGAPDDIRVKHNGKKIDVKEITMTTQVTAEYGNGVREKTKYRHPAALIRVRRNNKIELTSGDKTVELNIKGKVGKGITFLVLEAPITLGIGTVVDLATLSFFYTPSKYLDVDAAFNKSTPKSKKELYKIALENSNKTVITEIRTR